MQTQDPKETLTASTIILAALLGGANDFDTETHERGY